MEIQRSGGKCQGHRGTQSIFFFWLTSFHHLHEWWGLSVRYRVPGQKRAPGVKNGRGQLLNCGLHFEPRRSGVASLTGITECPGDQQLLQTLWAKRWGPQTLPQPKKWEIPAFVHRNMWSTYRIPETMTHQHLWPKASLSSSCKQTRESISGEHLIVPIILWHKFITSMWQIRNSDFT